jgi:hypothetical protein
MDFYGMDALFPETWIDSEPPALPQTGLITAPVPELAPMAAPLIGVSARELENDENDPLGVKDSAYG